MTEKCEECGELFRSTNERDAHWRRSHEVHVTAQSPATLTYQPGARWECPLCDERFPSQAALLAHSLRPHYRSNRTISRSLRYSSA
jgi:hypothetical protein